MKVMFMFVSIEGPGVSGGARFGAPPDPSLPLFGEG